MPMRTVLGFVAYVAEEGTVKPLILKGAQGKVYSVNDVGLTTPLACRDLKTETVITNPTSNEDGFILPFKVSISETASGILWVVGEYAIYQPFLGVKGADSIVPGPPGDDGKDGTAGPAGTGWVSNIGIDTDGRPYFQAGTNEAQIITDTDGRPYFNTL